MNMRDIFYQKIENYPKIIASQITSLKDLEQIPDGTYQLDGPLPIKLIKELPYFNNCYGEIGIVCIENKWLLAIARAEVIAYPAEITGYIKNGAQFHAHSHSHTSGYNTGVPSISDLAFKGIDGYIYIIFDKGITEVDTSSISSICIEDAWHNWIINVLKLTEFEFSQFDVFSLENELYDKIGLKRRIISFEEFEDILIGKKKLKSDFWDREAKQTPFPGKVK